MDIKKVLSGLYASEIHGGIAWTYDGGFNWWIGGDNWDFAAARGAEKTVEEAAQAMHAAALREYPDSEYAREDAYRLACIHEIMRKAGCTLFEAASAGDANNLDIEAAVAEIRRSVEACGTAFACLSTPPARELTPEMVQAVKEASAELAGLGFLLDEAMALAVKLRAAFGLEGTTDTWTCGICGARRSGVEPVQDAECGDSCPEHFQEATK